MKKTIKFAAVALCAAALAISCNKESIQINVEKAQPEMVTFTCQLPDIDTKVAITPDGTAGKVAWEVGDAIHIHTGHIKSGEYTTVTLTEDDISADGKTATIKFEALTPYDYSEWGTNYAKYYAAYPADATSNRSSCYSKNEFGKTNNILMAACDDGAGNFKFYNLCGIISFEVNGDYDSYVFSGNTAETIGYDNYAVEINRDSQDYMYKWTEGPKTSISGDLKTGVNYICLPNGANFTGGFTFKFKKDGAIVKVATTENGVDVARNKMLVLGDITSHLTDYEAPTTSDHITAITDATDLGSTETANCYIVTTPGAYKLPVVKGNTSASAGNVFAVALLWETYNNSETVEENSVIAAVDFDGPENYIYFSTPQTLKPGNALIAAKDSEGNIIWSWHIWIPETDITTGTYGFSSSVAMMDRNLGALHVAAAGSVDAASCGMYYQWGRKDPFMTIGDFSSKTVATTSPSGVWSAKSATMTISSSIENPTTFAYGSEDWTSEPNDNLWQDSSKTQYDPCPPGYKVPAYGTPKLFEYVNPANYDAWAWNSDCVVAGTVADGTTVLPYNGLVYYSTGVYDGVAARVRLWTCTQKGTGLARALDLKYADKSTSGTGQKRASGNGIRCIVN